MVITIIQTLTHCEDLTCEQRRDLLDIIHRSTPQLNKYPLSALPLGIWWGAPKPDIVNQENHRPEHKYTMHWLDYSGYLCSDMRPLVLTVVGRVSRSVPSDTSTYKLYVVPVRAQDLQAAHIVLSRFSDVTPPGMCSMLLVFCSRFAKLTRSFLQVRSVPWSHSIMGVKPRA